MFELPNMSELPPDIAEHLNFKVLETLRSLGQLATEDSERSGEFIAMIDLLYPLVGPFTPQPGKILEVTTIDPDSRSPFKIGVERERYIEDGELDVETWFPPKTMGAYKRAITKKDNGQQVFSGDIYSYQGHDDGFQISDLVNKVFILLTPNLKVELVDETTEKFIARRMAKGLRTAGRLGFAVPKTEDEE